MELLQSDPRSLSPTVDVLARLIGTRLLIQAASGAGKSWALRRLLEQTHGCIQQFVIDPEGEFRTLRDRFQFIVCGFDDDDDINLSEASAHSLALELFHQRVSVVLDLSEMGFDERRDFVGYFLKGLMAAPKEEWHAAIVVIDEAHLFCPQRGDAVDAESKASLRNARRACIELTTRGRKRGLCPVMATQRLAKLNKDVAAELNNKLIGRTVLDVDIRRVSDELGLTYNDARALVSPLTPGDFIAYGPVFTAQLQKIHIGDVQTKHGVKLEIEPVEPLSSAQLRDVVQQIQLSARPPETTTRVDESPISASPQTLHTPFWPSETGVRLGSLPKANREVIRIAALSMMAGGRSVTQVAVTTGIPLSTLFYWHARSEASANHSAAVSL